MSPAEGVDVTELLLLKQENRILADALEEKSLVVEEEGEEEKAPASRKWHKNGSSYTRTCQEFTTPERWAAIAVTSALVLSLLVPCLAALLTGNPAVLISLVVSFFPIMLAGFAVGVIHRAGDPGCVDRVDER